MSANTVQLPSVEEATSLNLVPMVDIMFLMLLFFMLGADMGQRELEAVELPKALSVKKDDGDAPKEGRTTVNVYHATRGCPDAEGGVCRNASHWRVGVRGSDFDANDPQDYNRLRALLRADATAGATIVVDEKHPSERSVMLRGDKSAPYGIVQLVIQACAQEHLYKVESGAAAPPGTR